MMIRRKRFKHCKSGLSRVTSGCHGDKLSRGRVTNGGDGGNIVGMGLNVGTDLPVETDP